MPLQKHPLERLVYEISFAGELVAAETISNPSVSVLKVAGATLEDVSDEFLEPANPAPLVLNNDTVQFWLIEESAEGAQDERAKYVILCQVQTSTGQVLVAQDAKQKLPQLKLTRK